MATGGSPPYRFSPAGSVPPLHHYGTGDTVRFTGSTHDENAYITRDPETVGALNRHLIAKIDEHRSELELVDADLEEGAPTLLVSYGITSGAMRVAVRAARERGLLVSAITVRSLWPVPEDAITHALRGVRRVVVAELNPGLYRREIERVAGGRVVDGIARIDGDLITPEQLVEAAA